MTCQAALLTYDGSVKKRFFPCDAAWWLSVEVWPAVTSWRTDELRAFLVFVMTFRSLLFFNNSACLFVLFVLKWPFSLLHFCCGDFGFPWNDWKRLKFSSSSAFYYFYLDNRHIICDIWQCSSCLALQNIWHWLATFLLQARFLFHKERLPTKHCWQCLEKWHHSHTI